MKLKLQLMLISCSLVLIPWSGCEFIRANEQALIKLQQQSLEVAGENLARGLANQINLLYTAQARATAPLDTGSILAEPMTAPPVLDGYFDEWDGVFTRQFGTQRRPILIRAGVVENRLYLAISVFENTKNYNDRGLGQEPSGDRLVFSTWHGSRKQNYVIATSAPGTVTAKVLGRQLPQADPESIRGTWTDVGFGYQLELTMPLTTASDRLGMYYIDVDEGGISTRGNIDPLTTSAPPWLVFSTPKLQRWIQNYNDQSIGLLVLDRWGWPLAQSIVKEPETPSEHSALVLWLYEQALKAPEFERAPLRSIEGRLQDPIISSALRGQPEHSLVSIDGELRSRYATPINSPEGVVGVLVTEQARARYLSISANAFEGFLLSGSLALLTVVLAFLGFAIVISVRIGRLRQEVAQVPDQAEVTFSKTPLDDEIDELAHQFQRHVEEQRQLHGYLRALPRTLTHEIRTPIAIIRATLETLQENELDDVQRAELIDRARGGLGRLTRIMDAMNEATRLEATLGSEPKTAINLSDLLADLCSAYAQTFPSWRFVIDNPQDQAPAPVAADLIVQALDKLVANATSFSKIGNVITLRLERRGLWWRLSVANEGPLLPNDASDLFAPMTSTRKQSEVEEHHLGLGLYIVALVAKHHGGEPYARNLPTEDGVDIGFTLHG